MAHEPKQSIRTSEKTLDILEALRELDGAGVTELANALGFSKSTVHNHLSTLVKREYVVKEDDTYRLGLRLLALGGYTRNRMDFYSTAKPEVCRLADETGELTNMATHEYGKCVYLYRVKGDDAIDLDTYAGFSISMHNTALGKAILAHLPKEEVREILDERGMEWTTERTITDPDVLFEELEAIHDRGYAFDREERLDGLRCVAAPVKRNDGHVWGAISVASPTRRMSDDRFENEIPELILGAVNVIEINMTYS